MGNLLTGDKVRLIAMDADRDPALYRQWARDAEFLQLFNTGPARALPAATLAEEIRNSAETPTEFFFAIQTLTDARVIGVTDLSVNWTHQDAYFGIGIGARADWGQGYGSDATRVIARFGFEELNLHRITLNVFEYNLRAIHVYEKLGFVVEGRLRQRLTRHGRRWDMVFMGLLRDEWQRRSTA